MWSRSPGGPFSQRFRFFIALSCPLCRYAAPGNEDRTRCVTPTDDGRRNFHEPEQETTHPGTPGRPGGDLSGGDERRRRPGLEPSKLSHDVLVPGPYVDDPPSASAGSKVRRTAPSACVPVTRISSSSSCANAGACDSAMITRHATGAGRPVAHPFNHGRVPRRNAATPGVAGVSALRWPPGTAATPLAREPAARQSDSRARDAYSGIPTSCSFPRPSSSAIHSRRLAGHSLHGP